MLDLGPDGSVYKESACNVGDLGLIPGLGRSPGEETSYLLQYSGLENSMDCRVHVVAKSRTGLSDFHVHFKRACHLKRGIFTSAFPICMSFILFSCLIALDLPVQC